MFVLMVLFAVVLRGMGRRDILGWSAGCTSQCLNKDLVLTRQWVVLFAVSPPTPLTPRGAGGLCIFRHDHVKKLLLMTCGGFRELVLGVLGLVVIVVPCAGVVTVLVLNSQMMHSNRDSTLPPVLVSRWCGRCGGGGGQGDDGGGR